MVDRQRTGFKLPEKMPACRRGAIQHFPRPVEFTQGHRQRLDKRPGGAFSGLADGVADGPTSGLNLITALVRLACERFPGRFGRFSGGAQARDNYLGQARFADDSLQNLADFSFDSGCFRRIATGDFNALVVLLESCCNSVPGLHEFLVKRQKFSARPVTLHPDLLPEFLQQLRQGAYYTPLLVCGPSLLLNKQRLPGAFRSAHAEIGKTYALFAGSDQCNNRSQPFGDFSLLSNPLICIWTCELLRANGLEKRFLTLQNFDYLCQGQLQRLARADLQRRQHLFEARDNTALRFGCSGEIGGLHLLDRFGHTRGDTGFLHRSPGVSCQSPQIARLVSRRLEDLDQAETHQPKILLRMEGSGRGRFPHLNIQFEGLLQERLLTTDQKPHPLDEFGQLPPQAKAFPFGQDPKQDLVHPRLCFLISLSPLGALQLVCLRQQCDSLFHLLTDQGSRSFLHVLQVGVERDVAHLVLFELLQVRLQNPLEQSLHEPAGLLLVVSLARNNLLVAPGGLT